MIMASAVKQGGPAVIRVADDRAISSRMQTVIAEFDSRFLTLQELMEELRGPLHSDGRSRFLGRSFAIHDHSLGQGIRPGRAEIEYNNGVGEVTISNRVQEEWDRIPSRRRAIIEPSAMTGKPIMVTVGTGKVFITISSGHGQQVSLAYIGPEELDAKEVVTALASSLRRS